MCEICVAGGANANLFVDGRYISEVNKEMNISIEKADNFTSFLRKQDFDFYKRLSEKLKFDYGRN
jgi:NAD kinase